MANVEDTLNLLKGARLVVASKTAAYTVTDEDCVILVDATAGAVTVTLPAVAQERGAGRFLCIKKTDVSANAVTVDGSGAETIDGAATVSLAAQYDSALLIEGPSGWHLMAASV